MLPKQIALLERGWLSSNNILLRDERGAALVDSGYVTHAPQTLALVEHALAGARLEWLVNTHCHSDHMGGNAALHARYACRITVPVGEAPLIEAWDERALMLGFADQRADRFHHDDTYAPGAILRLGGLEWEALAAPGHDTHALMLHAPAERILVTGDALWENGFGVIFPQLYGRETAFRETRETLERIAAVAPRVVIPGHGRAFTEVDAALARAFSRLDALEADILRLVRHTLKVMLTFALLERRAMALAALPRYVQDVGILRDLNERFLQLPPAALAEWLVTELERAGAAKRDNGTLVPLVAA